MSRPVILPGRFFVFCRKRNARLLSYVCPLFFLHIHNIFYFNSPAQCKSCGVKLQRSSKRKDRLIFCFLGDFPNQNLLFFFFFFFYYGLIVWTSFHPLLFLYELLQLLGSARLGSALLLWPHLAPERPRSARASAPFFGNSTLRVVTNQLFNNIQRGSELRVHYQNYF